MNSGLRCLQDTKPDRLFLQITFLSRFVCLPIALLEGKGHSPGSSKTALTPSFDLGLCADPSSKYKNTSLSIENVVHKSRPTGKGVATQCQIPGFLGERAGSVVRGDGTSGHWLFRKTNARGRGGSSLLLWCPTDRWLLCPANPLPPHARAK